MTLGFKRYTRLLPQIKSNWYFKYIFLFRPTLNRERIRKQELKRSINVFPTCASEKCRMGRVDKDLALA